MTPEKIKETYLSHSNLNLFVILVNMTNRKKYKKFDTFNTPEQVDNSINMLIEVFTERGIVFKKLALGKKWETTDFDEQRTFIKLYSKSEDLKGQMIFDAIGQY